MHQNEIFNQLYDGLNARQKEAVDTLEGPVMVIAGPGTGKTQILSARIGKILLETDTDAGSILCLTYTDAGAVAMRRRLAGFTGANTAYKVNIYTFHAFCNDIIQDNLSHFEKNALDLISDLEQIEYLKHLIDTLPRNHPLKRYRSDAYFEVKNLRALFSTMKKEGLTPDFISRRIDSYLEAIENSEKYIYKRNGNGFRKGDKKQGDLDQERERMERLRAGAAEFIRFQELMRSKNRYDFDDMIEWVIRAFSENEDLLRRYQEKYLYILVDEYQDTSGTQNRLVQLLINFWDKPNIFVVGDDDQSIYRFQGASMANLLQFRNQYMKDLKTVVLTDNYRSTQPILDVSKTFIDRNTGRLINEIEGLTKELIAARAGRKELLHPPVIREYDQERLEMIDIVTRVEELISLKVPPGKIGVIYKQNNYGEELLSLFRRKNLPVFSKRKINLLENPMIAKIMLMLTWLDTEHELPFSGDEMLFEILHADWFQVPSIEIASITAELSHKHSNSSKPSLRKWLNDKINRPAPDLFSTGLEAHLAHAGRVLESLIGKVSNTTLQGLFECIFREAGIVNDIMNRPDKHELLQMLTSFFDFIKEETRRDPALNLHGLVNHLELMKKEEIPLPLVLVNGSAESVNLMTAHGSKGLEFEYVFFAGLNAHNWEKKKAPGGGFKFPITLFLPEVTSDNYEQLLQEYDLDEKKQEEEEMRRLFYVGLTRAEIHLFMSYCRFRNDGKDAEPSVFVAEIRDAFSIVPERPVIAPEILAEYQLLLLEGERAPEIETLERHFVNRLLENFQMNVTALNNYLNCPLEFYFKNLLRIPSPKNENTEFGSAVHFALEELFRKMQDNGNVFPSVDVFLKSFDSYMHRHQESFTKEQFQRRLEYGHMILPEYYTRHVGSWNPIVSIERNIRNVSLNGVPLKGKLDKLEFDGKLVNVVDYKTGNPEYALKKLKGPGDKEPNGGDYWRQAVFYKILLDQYAQKDWEAVSSEFDFIEPDNKKRYSKIKVPIKNEDIGIVSNQIAETWTKIQNHDFYTGCGKEDCHWCKFVKNNRLDVGVLVEEVE